MRVSIALATYNGARFLQEQLDSFVNQTRQPDELVICDDGSIDETLEIAERFAAAAPFKVSVHLNPSNLGYSRNFQAAAARCTGDIVFFSDQDDVWFPAKIERALAELEAHPNIQVVVNDQILTDEALRHRGITKLGNLERLKRTSDGLIEGCCTAYRRPFGELLFPVPTAEPDLVKELSHDLWINELAIALRVRAVIREPLQFFRRHDSTTTNWLVSAPRPVGIGDLVKTRLGRAPAEAWLRRTEVLQLFEDCLRSRRHAIERKAMGDVEAALNAIELERRSLKARSALVRLPAIRRPGPIRRLWMQGGYAYFHGWKSALRDLVRGA